MPMYAMNVKRIEYNNPATESTAQQQHKHTRNQQQQMCAYFMRNFQRLH